MYSFINSKIFCVLHDKVALLTGSRSKLGNKKNRQKRINSSHYKEQILVITKLNERLLNYDFILRVFVCDIIRPTKELPA